MGPECRMQNAAQNDNVGGGGAIAWYGPDGTVGRHHRAPAARGGLVPVSRPWLAWSGSRSRRAACLACPWPNLSLVKFSSLFIHGRSLIF